MANASVGTGDPDRGSPEAGAAPRAQPWPDRSPARGDSPGPGEGGGGGYRIRAFEGLRGGLAWWVVLFHLYLHSGIDPSSLPKVERRLAFGGWAAVDLFIILSGFVITLLIEGRRESYGTFLVRRFFRLAPVYYALVGFGVAQALWRGMDAGRLRDHLLVHLTILHGLVPDEILEGSANALCHPAWSISVEWQFYLLAPFVLASIRGSGSRALGLLLGCLATSGLLLRLYTWPFQATAVMRAGQFAIGIGSYYLYHHAVGHPATARRAVPYLLPGAWAFAWVLGGDTLSAGVIWPLLFATALAPAVGAETAVTRPLRWILERPATVWLGKVSYSTYLCHNFALTLVESALGGSWGRMGGRGRILALVGLGVPLILAFSAALHALVEKPGIRLGGEVTARLARRQARVATTRYAPPPGVPIC